MAAHQGAAALIEAIATSSPYLWDLARADPGRLVALLESDPDARLAACLAQAARDLRDGVSQTQSQLRSQADAMRILREMKAEAALLIALADIGGLWEVMRVTRALTEVADTAVGAAVHHLLAGAARAGRLAPPDPDRPEVGSGYIVLAMGKMGAGELNYSSDIDLMVFFDPAAPAIMPGVEPAVAVRAPDPPARQNAAGAHRRKATCFASTCGCARTPPRPRSRSRFRPPSIITRAGARTGNVRR